MKTHLEYNPGFKEYEVWGAVEDQRELIGIARTKRDAQRMQDKLADGRINIDARKLPIDWR